MLTVWGRKSSSNVQAVMWCIGELGLAYRRHDVGHSYGGNDTPAFLAMNPNGTIPVLRDGDGPPLWESGAILRYLCGRYAAPSFWPLDPIARAEVDMWAGGQRLTSPCRSRCPSSGASCTAGDVAGRTVGRSALGQTPRHCGGAPLRAAVSVWRCVDAGGYQFAHRLYRYWT